MAKRKTVTLVLNTDTTVTVTGRGQLLISNHGIPGTATPNPVYVNINAAATVAGDEMTPVMGGRPRVLELGDQDGSVDVHLICAAANIVSVELVTPGVNELVL